MTRYCNTPFFKKCGAGSEKERERDEEKKYKQKISSQENIINSLPQFHHLHILKANIDCHALLLFYLLVCDSVFYTPRQLQITLTLFLHFAGYKMKNSPDYEVVSICSNSLILALLLYENTAAVLLLKKIV